MTVDLSHRFDGPDDAPVLVLSNSLGTTMEIWEDQLPALTERFRVLRYDTRGHGGSPAPDGPYTIAELGEDLLALLDGLGLEQVSFCGLSIGGMIGIWLASEAPERIEDLVLSCTTAHFPPRELWDERIATVLVQGSGALVEAALERWLSDATRLERPEAAERIGARLAETSPTGYAGCCTAIRDMDLRDRLAAIRAPTLVVTGGDDPATPLEMNQAVADGIDNAHLVVLPGARHLANVDHPEDYTRTIMEHLS
jgi:3-oxoadipate enol-lactonase